MNNLNIAIRRKNEFDSSQDLVSGSYKMSEEALSIGSSADLIKSLNTLDYSNSEIYNAKNIFLRLLNSVRNARQLNEQADYNDVKNGIKSMYNKFENNEAYIAAPRDEEERRAFYTNLGKGFKIISDILYEEFANGNIDNVSLYSCLELIGEGASHCALVTLEMELIC
jgi:hypothetical protein